jgi:ribosome biogenesis GTPase / thiamine phosphate phosphatase
VATGIVPWLFLLSVRKIIAMKANNTERTLQGIVIKKTIGQYSVQVDGQIFACTVTQHSGGRMQERTGRLSGGYKGNGFLAVETIAVGDRVGLVQTQANSGRIVEVLPRHNQFARRAAVAMSGAHASEQVIAANVDQIVPVFAAANPEPHWKLLDRYLVAAEAQELRVLICISKVDLVSEQGSRAWSELETALNEYQTIGYPVVRISSVTGEGLAALKTALQGRLSVLLGKSGVGKTSLLNAIQPGLGLRVSAVNQITGKGKHTTTIQEMFDLDGGGGIVDTPGEREFGLWDVSSDELASFFPEMRPHLGRCRFGLDCAHEEEPGCAVRKAVMEGQISPQRYQSYLRLRDDP